MVTCTYQRLKLILKVGDSMSPSPLTALDNLPPCLRVVNSEQVPSHSYITSNTREKTRPVDTQSPSPLRRMYHSYVTLPLLNSSGLLFLSSDNHMCGVHFTDQQYEYDSTTGDVIVKWQGTGPSASVQVSQFTCKVDDKSLISCEFFFHGVDSSFTKICFEMSK